MASASSSANIASIRLETTRQHIDWQAYAKTDKYYIKKFEAETNITGLLVMDLSRSMGYTYRQELTKFDYAICLAASLAYLMISQHDPVGLITFSDRIRESLQPHSKRTQLGNLLSLLARQKPVGETNLAGSLNQICRDAQTQNAGDDLFGLAGRC